MKILTGWARVVTFVAVAVAFLRTPALTQNGGAPQMPTSISGSTPFQRDNPKSKLEDDPLGISAHKQAVMRNTERQKKLVSDTERLLALAAQLHDDLGKTDQQNSPADEVKRAEEIEKLARSVKDRMKG